MTQHASKVCSFAPFLVLLLLGAAGWERDREGPKKDKRAIILYGAQVGKPLILDDRMKANLVDLLLGRVSFGERRLGDATGRPCIGVAVFTEIEWSLFSADGLTPSDIGPGVVATRIRFFPARADIGPVVHRAGAGVLVEVHPEAGQVLMDEGVIPFDLARVDERACDVVVEIGEEPQGFEPLGGRSSADPWHQARHRAPRVMRTAGSLVPFVRQITGPLAAPGLRPSAQPGVRRVRQRPRRYRKSQLSSASV